jgi:hypothetical protein
VAAAATAAAATAVTAAAAAAKSATAAAAATAAAGARRGMGTRLLYTGRPKQAARFWGFGISKELVDKNPNTNRPQRGGAARHGCMPLIYRQAKISSALLGRWD